jgi:hypothetical protein
MLPTVSDVGIPLDSRSEAAGPGNIGATDNATYKAVSRLEAEENSNHGAAAPSDDKGLIYRPSVNSCRTRAPYRISPSPRAGETSRGEDEDNARIDEAVRSGLGRGFEIRDGAAEEEERAEESLDRDEEEDVGGECK